MSKSDFVTCPPRCIKAREVPGLMFCDRCPHRPISNARVTAAAKRIQATRYIGSEFVADARLLAKAALAPAGEGVKTDGR